MSIIITILPSCPICDTRCESKKVDDGFRVDCLKCTRYFIADSTIKVIQDKFYPQNQKAATSNWLSRNTDIRIRTEDLDRIFNPIIPPVAQKADSLLRYLGQRYPVSGSEIDIRREVFPDVQKSLQGMFPLGAARDASIFYYKLLTTSWSTNEQELFYLLDFYLTQHKSFLTSSSKSIYRITPKGWDYLESAPNKESSQAFVAMRFRKDLTPLFTDAIVPAVRNAGYNPVRIDGVEHVNRIDDEIIAQIRRSRFCIADFTRQNRGVYFEAGFALGLGIPVIWTCKQFDLNRSHFDTRQYNTIDWTSGNLPEFSKRLQNRIEAVLGKGPLEPPKV